ncbi:peptide chain release factor N(5)-glutamine methyltransferase [Aliiglaciecola sp. CAU 1673]|uniref:peptide chain release factor N(5)-glutamine methyltransferase n=1 Tax=Aliiglaciecola sp. CAU 1673 TaxID=3032595 RepID=UPI0023D9DF68|nr:peptide chain release factor N(5)-glutamine methyltransferase [Aliiglaciecola sp. CAU 1673]MDF2179390.1 peptide chain release factor N(5)-glutamine methyltransferase [Aliiglaciecola sp. CAU 1673]
MRPETPVSIAQALTWAKSQFAASESPALDAKVLLAHCLEKPAIYLHTWPERALSEAQWQQFQSMVVKREAGHPIAHLIGYRDFWSLRLNVSPHTLIPRPETELLVETALSLCEQRAANVLDLGTGTGAIALALASERPDWQVLGVDIKAEAVALANDNARINQVTNARFLQSDWFDAIEAQRFDLILSNPPYVDPASPYLAQGDVRFEPLSALIADNAGMADLLKIIQLSVQYLVDSGLLLLEHGYDQGENVRDLLNAHGFTDVRTVQDLAGLDRVTLGRLG